MRTMLLGSIFLHDWAHVGIYMPAPEYENDIKSSWIREKIMHRIEGAIKVYGSGLNWLQAEEDQRFWVVTGRFCRGVFVLFGSVCGVWTCLNITFKVSVWDSMQSLLNNQYLDDVQLGHVQFRYMPVAEKNSWMWQVRWNSRADETERIA